MRRLTIAPARPPRNWKRVRAALGLAEERTQARSRLFLGDLLFFLLLLFLLLFLLLGGRRCRGGGGRGPGRGPPGPAGGFPLPRRGPSALPRPPRPSPP